VLPFCSMNPRCLIVLSVFFTKRKGWAELTGETLNSINSRFWKKGNFWKNQLIFTLAVTFSWHCLRLDFFGGAPNLTLSSDNVLLPSPGKVERWKFLLFDCFFAILPFDLPQQVDLCAVVLTMVLSSVFPSSENKIHRESLFFQGRQTNHVTLQGEGETVERSTEEKLKKWGNFHWKADAFDGQYRRFFSPQFCWQPIL
jgi:hypothetical protein